MPCGASLCVLVFLLMLSYRAASQPQDMPRGVCSCLLWGVMLLTLIPLM